MPQSALPLSAHGYTVAVTNTRGYHVGLETHISSGYQYITFIQDLTGSQRQQIVARRPRYPTVGAWQRVASLPIATNNFNDPHNTCSLHVIQSGADSGKLSLNWDNHDDPLKYFQGRVAGNLNVYGPAPVPIASGSTLEAQVTYLIEREHPTGDRNLLFRTGISGNGDLVIYHKAPGGAWTIKQASYFDGKTTSVSMYWDRWRAKNGILHTSGNIRNTDSDYRTNHDLYDLGYSDDYGATWKNHATGAALTIPLTPANTPKIATINTNTGLWNTATMAIDDSDRPYIFRCYGAAPSQYQCHYLQGSLGSGTWAVSQAGTEVTGSSFVDVASPAGPFWLSPPQACHHSGSVGMLHWSDDRGDSGLWVKYATVAALQAGTPTWTTSKLSSKNWKNMDTHPNYDEALWEAYGMMDVMFFDTDGSVSVETLSMPF